MKTELEQIFMSVGSFWEEAYRTVLSKWKRQRQFPPPGLFKFARAQLCNISTYLFDEDIDFLPILIIFTKNTLNFEAIS